MPLSGEYEVHLVKDNCIELDDRLIKHLYQENQPLCFYVTRLSKKERYIELTPIEKGNIKLNKNNMVQIPKNLVNIIKDGEELVILGVLNYLELWLKENFYSWIKKTNHEEVAEKIPGIFI